jgi:hypothetical protein
MRPKRLALSSLILVILGDMFEGAFRQSLSMSEDSRLCHPADCTHLDHRYDLSVILLVKFLRRVPKALLVREKLRSSLYE